MGRGSFHIVNTNIILNDTIIDADIKTTAAITRTKMNEDNDIRARNGAKIYAYETGNAKYFVIEKSSVNTNFDSDEGSFYFRPQTGGIYCAKPGLNNWIYLNGSGGSNYIRVGNDNTDGEIKTNSGNLNINPASDIYALQNLFVRTGKQLRVHNAANTGYIQMTANATSGDISGNVGYIEINAQTGVVELSKFNTNNVLKIYASDNTKILQLEEDNTDGKISTNSGKIILDPTTSVDFNNKPIIAVNDITYNAAVIRYASISHASFNVENNANYVIDSSKISSSDNTIRNFRAGISLPHGAIVTSVLVSWFRDDGAATGEIDLERNVKTGGGLDVMASCDSDASTGWHDVEDTSISNATVDNSGYTYSLVAILTPNDAKEDVMLSNIIITYTITKPLP